MITIGIVGGTGYTGVELLRILARHPGVRVEVLTSRQEAGQRADQLFPQLRGHSDAVFSAPDPDALSRCQAVFFATPHGACMQMAPKLVDAGVRVIDLSADFRLRDPATYQRWYQQAHAAPALLEEAAYGLPEVHREAIRTARIVGNPGCYPTAVQLGFLPLLQAGVIDRATLIANCASGVSGAGREAKVGNLFCEVADSFKAYGVGGHRHSAEIDQELGTPVTFVPHLAPMIRGIHATLYATLTDANADLQAIFERRYAGERFVDVMPAGAHPDTRGVRGANQCRIAVHRPNGGARVIVLAVIDNLVKGAAGQAVQNFNLMFGLDETLGLDAPPLAP